MVVNGGVVASTNPQRPEMREWSKMVVSVISDVILQQPKMVALA